MAYSYKNSNIEWLGQIPEHWKIDRIKDKTISVVGGDWGNDPESNSKDEKIVVLRVSDLENIYFSFQNLTHRKIKDSSVKTRLVTDNSLLIEKSGGGEKQIVGRVGYPKGINFRAICSNFMAKIEFNKTINLSFMNYYFNFLYDRNVNFQFVQQTTGIQNLNVGYYLKTQIAFPPLPEQKAIAANLDQACARIDRIIEIKERQLEGIEKFYNSQIVESVIHGLDKKELKKVNSKWIDGIPSHWKRRKIKRVCKVFRGKFTHRPRNDPRFYDGKYPFVQTGDVTNSDKYITSYSQTLNERGLAVSQLFPENTLTMTIAANIGDVAILTFKSCFPDSIVGFKPNWELDVEYLYYLFKGIKQDFLSTAIVTTQLNLNITRIEDVDCFIPPMQEQKEIVSHLNNVKVKNTKLKQNLFKQIKNLKNYRKSLIHECVTGKKQVYKQERPEMQQA